MREATDLNRNTKYYCVAHTKKIVCKEIVESFIFILKYSVFKFKKKKKTQVHIEFVFLLQQDNNNNNDKSTTKIIQIFKRILF